MAEELNQGELFAKIDAQISDESPSIAPLTAFPRHETGAVPTVRRLWLANVKSFETLEVSFSGFNVLVGANGCGKTTILQALDLAFRLIQFHAEFHKGQLSEPRAGKLLLDEMLPVGDPADFWFKGVSRRGNVRIPATIGVELEGSLEFEFEIRRLWGGLNSRMTKLPVGQPESRIRDMLGRRAIFIPPSSGVVVREEYRTPARLEMLTLTGRQNEVLRNQLLSLAHSQPAVFKSLCSDLLHHFPGSIKDVSFDPASDQYISALYGAEDYTHDIFSGGGGFLQFLQMLVQLYLHSPGVVLLDEPDVHLHCSLQHGVVDMLASLSSSKGVQIVMATHSKEIINYVDADSVLPVALGATSVEPLQKRAPVLPILKDLGSIDNVDIAMLLSSRRCVFVEGDTDSKLLRRFAAKLGFAVFEGGSQVVIIVAEGVDHPEKYVGLDVLEKFIGHDVSALVIRDRDGLPDDAVAEIQGYVKEKGRNVVVLGRNQIENYLLVPELIWRVVIDRLTHAGIAAESHPTQEEVIQCIDASLDSLEDETFDSIATQIAKHRRSYDGKHIDQKSANTQAREFMKSRWDTREGRFDVVLGKKALSSIRRRIQERWKVSFGDERLVAAMEDAEIHRDLKALIARVEEL